MTISTVTSAQESSPGLPATPDSGSGVVTLAATLLLVFAVRTVAAQEQPAYALTTDTPQYCAHLTRELAAQHSLLPDVQHLLQEGSQMCSRGLVKGGILRLRRALVILHHRAARVEPVMP